MVDDDVIIIVVPGPVVPSVVHSLVVDSAVVESPVVGPRSVVALVVGLVVGSSVVVVVEVVDELDVVLVWVPFVVVAAESVAASLPAVVSDPDGEKQAGLSSAKKAQNPRDAIILTIVQ
ncbi:hypothetical protein [Nannocystis punicea]|uniref:Uncharacterized protein n=1 Tax=Nannocystis punicea TaxID=2995304 RepID=A0ABY7HDJ4_9BACT|nr:hypothetical protein [Nannocystis poenicansa]WAS97361.1 hypothetical protein O0S08_14535 [Nannocystis poenicansa]